MNTTYEPTDRTRLRRRPQRGAYDAVTIHGILDAGLIAHIGYLDDGHPIVTPTAYWREGGRVYWHGSSAGRATRAQLAGRISFTVSLVDGLVLGRSAITHSMLYRSVMAFGTPKLVEDPEDKRRAATAFIEGLFPGRMGELREIREVELAAINVLYLQLEEVSAKVKTGGVNELEGDLGAACWAGVVPLRLISGEPLRDPRLRDGVALSPSLSAYCAGEPVEAALKRRGDP